MFVWSPEKDKLLFELWNQKLTATKIGEKLGTTKGSVLGRRKRLLDKGVFTDAASSGAIPVVDSPSLVEVHPAFDPSDGTWFLDDGTEAKSISELLAKLPEGYVIKDYYQRG